MHLQNKLNIIVLSLGLILLAGCGAATPSEPTQSPEQIYTQVAGNRSSQYHVDRSCHANQYHYPRTNHDHDTHVGNIIHQYTSRWFNAVAYPICHHQFFG